MSPVCCGGGLQTVSEMALEEPWLACAIPSPALAHVCPGHKLPLRCECGRAGGSAGPLQPILHLPAYRKGRRRARSEGRALRVRRCHAHVALLAFARQWCLRGRPTWLPAPCCSQTMHAGSHGPHAAMGQLHLRSHSTGLCLHADTQRTSTATCGGGSSCCARPRGRGTRSTASPLEMQTRCCTSPRCPVTHSLVGRIQHARESEVVAVASRMLHNVRDVSPQGGVA